MPIRREFSKRFFKRWSYNMAYILGFLFADGNIIRTKRNTHFIAFYTNDRNLLSSIKESLGSSHKIVHREKDNNLTYVLQIGSKELFKDLIKLGLTPNKARRMRFPNIPIKYRGDFIRGYFDGDGNVWSGYINKNRKKPTLILNLTFTSASKMFLIGLYTSIKEMGVCGGSIYDIRNKNCSRLQYSTLDTLKIHRIMYNRPCKLVLTRKRLVFDRFIKMRP